MGESNCLFMEVSSTQFYVTIKEGLFYLTDLYRYQLGTYNTYLHLQFQQAFVLSKSVFKVSVLFLKTKASQQKVAVNNSDMCKQSHKASNKQAKTTGQRQSVTLKLCIHDKKRSGRHHLWR